MTQEDIFLIQGMIDKAIKSHEHMSTDSKSINFRNLKITPGDPLTAENSGTLNTGDVTSDTIIGNIRSRVGQIEDRLQEKGLIE